MVELTYHVEKWSDSADDTRWLWPLHYNEASVDKGKVPLSVNEAEFHAMDVMGQMVCVTARNEEGAAVGYVWAVIRPHLHYKELLCAYFDAYFLHPAYRDGFNGVRLFQVIEDALRERGVQKIFSFTKMHNNKGKVFEYLGWKAIEVTYAKHIGDK